MAWTTGIGVSTCMYAEDKTKGTRVRRKLSLKKSGGCNGVFFMLCLLAVNVRVISYDRILMLRPSTKFIPSLGVICT